MACAGAPDAANAPAHAWRQIRKFGEKLRRRPDDWSVRDPGERVQSLLSDAADVDQRHGPGDPFANALDLERGIVRFLRHPDLRGPDAVSVILIHCHHVQPATGQKFGVRVVREDRQQLIPLAGLGGQPSVQHEHVGQCGRESGPDRGPGVQGAGHQVEALLRGP